MQGFWNFDDDENKEHDFVFVARAPTLARDDRSVPHLDLRAADDTTVIVSPAASAAHIQSLVPVETLSRPSSAALSGNVDLQAAVERAQSSTILVELSLDGQHFEHLSPLWLSVIGYVALVLRSANV
jgi:hypothetical protein